MFEPFKGASRPSWTSVRSKLGAGRQMRQPVVSMFRDAGADPWTAPRRCIGSSGDVLDAETVVAKGRRGGRMRSRGPPFRPRWRPRPRQRSKTRSTTSMGTSSTLATCSLNAASQIRPMVPTPSRQILCKLKPLNLHSWRRSSSVFTGRSGPAWCRPSASAARRARPTRGWCSCHRALPSCCDRWSPPGRRHRSPGNPRRLQAELAVAGRLAVEGGRAVTAIRAGRGLPATARHRRLRYGKAAGW